MVIPMQNFVCVLIVLVGFKTSPMNIWILKSVTNLFKFITMLLVSTLQDKRYVYTFHHAGNSYLCLKISKTNKMKTRMGQLGGISPHRSSLMQHVLTGYFPWDPYSVI